jgi:hypothetical protein
MMPTMTNEQRELLLSHLQNAHELLEKIVETDRVMNGSDLLDIKVRLDFIVEKYNEVTKDSIKANPFLLFRDMLK